MLICVVAEYLKGGYDFSVFYIWIWSYQMKLFLVSILAYLVCTGCVSSGGDDNQKSDKA